VSTIRISERYWLLSDATAQGGIDGDEQEQSAKAANEMTPLTIKKRTTFPLQATGTNVYWGAALGRPKLRPTPKPDQKSSVRRPHSMKLPSSTIT
jgi:hypothetical protein